MPLIAIWQIISAFGSVTIMPLLKKVPWQVWAIIGGVILVLMYGSYREKKGYRTCEIKTEQAAQKEVARQKTIAQQEIAKAKLREADAAQKLDRLSKELDNVVNDAAKLKTAKNECLPATITDRLRRMSR